MATLCSSGFTHGCYFQILNEQDGVRAFVATPFDEKETVVLDIDYARKWVDRQVAQYMRTIDNED